MADPFIGQIIIGGFSFAPQGWSFCDGSLLPVRQNAALYSLLGTAYGGDGSHTNFRLPDLRGRTPIGMGRGADGTSYNIGNTGGAETVSLVLGTMPTHSHAIGVAEVAATASLNGAVLANAGGGSVYAVSGPSQPLPLDPVAGTGGGAAHPNMQPYIALNFLIALTGTYPMRP